MIAFFSFSVIDWRQNNHYGFQGVSAMRKWIKELKCKRCGRCFTVKIGDAIMPGEAERLENPICNKCKLIIKLKKYV